MMVIFVLALMLFGGKKLPELARGFGKAMREFKRAASGVEDEIRRAMDAEAPVSPPRQHQRPPAPARPRPARVTDPSVTPTPTPVPPPAKPTSPSESDDGPSPKPTS
ncbi:MAG: twin-arginine translocase TatA/TatE family subunit [Candidatus Synoicihabitans palmerolidicus]|nr:twin-arginine translocase TatA/TatE family subunit [Candidatus Synoicihabitans palmerolidicus]